MTGDGSFDRFGFCHQRYEMSNSCSVGIVGATVMKRPAVRPRNPATQNTTLNHIYRRLLHPRRALASDVSRSPNLVLGVSANRALLPQSILQACPLLSVRQSALRAWYYMPKGPWEFRGSTLGSLCEMLDKLSRRPIYVADALA